uniref:Integrase catalytic domain-containing protein n=1 Tax=Tanacetum cinerariifolium TaxID=118510 RepID=A0A6L2KNI9_TANCI|nr:hypothetical protein [Tanacetum cinerariifolium]
MDLCGPMHVESINGKQYILVIVDDYFRYTWTHFMMSKDETLEVLFNFLRMIQRGQQAQVRMIQTDRRTEFVNKTLQTYFEEEGINHQTSIARTPEQKCIIERRNHTLVEAGRTMISASKIPLFLWVEAIATACYTQNRSLIIHRHKNKPYNIINERKPYLKFLHIFGYTCYIVEDGENLEKMKEKGDAFIFQGYANYSGPVPQSQMALEQNSLSPTRNLNNNEPSSSTLVQESVPTEDMPVTTSIKELKSLFGLMFDEYFNGDNQDVSKSFDASDKRQQHHDTTLSTSTNFVVDLTQLNIQATPKPTTQAPTVNADGNNNNQAIDAQFDKDEFITPFCTLVHEVVKLSSCNVDPSYMHTFYQCHPLTHH